MSRGHYQDSEDGRRSVALTLTNAVFAKLIKMGRELGKTPQRMAQELFDEAYVARCMGKGAKQQVAAAGGLADAIEDDLSQQLTEARAQLARMEARYDEQFAVRERALDQVVKAQDLAMAIGAERDKIEAERVELWRKNRELDGDRDVALAVAAELRGQVERMEAVIAGKDRTLLDQADEIREMREAAKGQLVIVNQASEILQRDERKPPIEIRGDTVKAQALPRTIKAMAAARNSPAAIARELGIPIDQVKAALA